MPKKSAAHLLKVDEAVRILGTTIGVNVPQAMILAGFPTKDTMMRPCAGGYVVILRLTRRRKGNLGGGGEQRRLRGT